LQPAFEIFQLSTRRVDSTFGNFLFERVNLIFQIRDGEQQFVAHVADLDEVFNFVDFAARLGRRRLRACNLDAARPEQQAEGGAADEYFDSRHEINSCIL
jgi:hypothetical protein